VQPMRQWHGTSVQPMQVILTPRSTLVSYVPPRTTWKVPRHGAGWRSQVVTRMHNWRSANVSRIRVTDHTLRRSGVWMPSQVTPMP